MRSEEEIQRAHDILTAVILGELPVPVAEGDRKLLITACDALCWVLHHDHSVAFASNLDKIERAADQLGYTLRPGSVRRRSTFVTEDSMVVPPAVPFVPPNLSGPELV